MQWPLRFGVCGKTYAAMLLSTAVALNCCAQEQGNLPNAPAPQPEVTVKSIPLNVLRDQKAIWTSPAKIRIQDLDWLVPLGAVTGLAIATDRDAMLHVVPIDTQLNNRSTSISNALTGGMVAAPVALFGLGAMKGSARAREAGLLGAESMIDGVIVEQGLKLVFWRERPGVDNSKGKFFQRSAGADGSFPSTHSVVAWSSAAVLADEYPSFMSRLLIYGAATGVSITRVAGQQHFPSDVVVGSAVGWLVGHYVFRHRHRESLDY